MKEITNNKDKYELDYVNAIIEDNYIIPGLNGKKVNELKSYYKMKENSSFLSSEYVFDETIPSISLENNTNLIIKKGNPLKKSVAILSDNNIIKDYQITYLNKLESICVNDNNCDKKYKVIPSLYVDNYSSYDITSGDIILISDSLTLSNYQYLLKKINFHGLKIVSLEKLISENNE